MFSEEYRIHRKTFADVQGIQLLYSWSSFIQMWNTRSKQEQHEIKEAI